MKLSSYCLGLRKLQLYIPSQPNNHKLDLLVQKFSLHTTFKNLLHTPLPGAKEMGNFMFPRKGARGSGFRYLAQPRARMKPHTGQP